MSFHTYLWQRGCCQRRNITWYFPSFKLSMYLQTQSHHDSSDKQLHFSYTFICGDHVLSFRFPAMVAEMHIFPARQLMTQSGWVNHHTFTAANEEECAVQRNHSTDDHLCCCLCIKTFSLHLLRLLQTPGSWEWLIQSILRTYIHFETQIWLSTFIEYFLLKSG